MAATSKKGKACIAYTFPSSWTVPRKSGVSLKYSPSRISTEAASKPTCVPTPAQQQYRCSPNNPFTSAVCVAGRRKSSPPESLFYLQGRIYGEKHLSPTYPIKELQQYSLTCATTPRYFTAFPYGECLQVFCLAYLCRFHWYRSLLFDVGLARLVSWVTALIRETCYFHVSCGFGLLWVFLVNPGISILKAVCSWYALWTALIQK